MRPKAALASVSVVAFAAACSTFEVRDVYRALGEMPQQKTEGADFAARFSPYSRFYSIGLIGLPVVPVRLRLSDQEQLTLETQLRLTVDADFSFAALPCLKLEPGKDLCPSDVELSAVAMVQDDGKAYKDKRPRWNWLPEFHRAPHLSIDPNSTTSGRITRQEVYDHYKYNGSRWGYLLVNMTYRYRCGTSCAPTLRLNGKDLILLSDRTLFDNVFTFARTREKDYKALEQVQ